MESNTEMPEFSTPPQIGKRLGVKPERVRRWIETGQLTAANLGDKGRPRYRVSTAELQAFLERRSGVRIDPPKRRRRRRAEPAAAGPY